MHEAKDGKVLAGSCGKINPWSNNVTPWGSALTRISVDTRGLNCPLPFFKLRRALRDAPAGTVIEVLSTDPLAPGDFAELCAAQGHRLIDTTSDGRFDRTLIAVVAAPLTA